MFFGGSCPSGAGKIWEYSFKHDTWTFLSSLYIPNGRHSFGTGLFIDPQGKKKIIIVGGRRDSSFYPNTYFFDVETKILSPGPNYPLVSCVIIGTFGDALPSNFAGC